MTSALPRISIVVPCFNAVQTIERTLKSLVAQNYPNLELLLMDGGSKDGTMDVVQQYCRYFKKIVSEPDRGQANAINKGFRLATGEIFGWLCADDELLPGALMHVAEMFAQHPQASLITGGCCRLFPGDTKIITEPQPRMWERISYQNGIEQPSTFWKADLHRRAGELDETSHYAFDWEWWNRLKAAGANPLTTSQVLSNYYFSDSNKTSTGSRKLVYEMHGVIRKYGPLHGRLADIYLFLYKHFDLYGYYDRPPTCGKVRAWFFKTTLKLLVKAFGKELIYCYNWNFASKQERGICWYK